MNATLEPTSATSDLEISRLESLIARADSLAAKVEVPAEVKPEPPTLAGYLSLPQSPRAPAESGIVRRLLHNRSITSGGLWQHHFANHLEPLISIEKEVLQLWERVNGRRSDADAERVFGSEIRGRLAFPGGESLPSLADLKHSFRQRDVAALQLQSRLFAPVSKLCLTGLWQLINKAEALIPEIESAEANFFETVFETYRPNIAATELRLAIRGARQRVRGDAQRNKPQFPSSLLGLVILPEEFKRLL